MFTLTLIYLTDDGLKSPVEVLAIFDHIEKKNKKKNTCNEFNSQIALMLLKKNSMMFQSSLNMLHLPGEHVLVCFTAVSLILKEVHRSQHILYLLSNLCDIKSVRLVIIIEQSTEL